MLKFGIFFYLYHITFYFQAEEVEVDFLRQFIVYDSGKRTNAKGKSIFSILGVVYLNFGQPALTLSFTNLIFLQVNNSFATIVNGPSVLKLFQLSNGDIFVFVACLQHIYKVRKSRITKLGQGVRRCNIFVEREKGEVTMRQCMC